MAGNPTTAKVTLMIELRLSQYARPIRRLTSLTSAKSAMACLIVIGKRICVIALCWQMAECACVAANDTDRQEAIKQCSGKWMKMSREAEKLRAKGERKQAISIYKAIIDERLSLGLMPGSERVELAKALSEDKNKAEAEKIYLQMIAEAEQKYGPTDSFMIFPLTSYKDFLAANNRPAEAAKIDKRLKLVQLRQNDLPVAEVKTILATAGQGQKQKVAAIMQLAQKLTDNDRDAKALYCLDAALKLDPKNAQCLSDRGEVHSRLGKESLAKRDYDAAISADANNASAHFRRALMYEGQEKFPQALADFDAALKANPNDMEALGWRAKLYARLGKNDKALADFTAAINIDSTKSWPYVQRGTLYQSMNKLPEAIADFTTLVGRYPQSTDYLELRAEALAKSGKFVEAVRDFDEIIKLDPELKYIVKRRTELARKISH